MNSPKDDNKDYSQRKIKLNMLIIQYIEEDKANMKQKAIDFLNKIINWAIFRI